MKCQPQVKTRIQYYDLLADLIASLREKDPTLFNSPSDRRSTQENPAWEQAVNTLMEQYPQLKDRQAVYMLGIEEDVANAVLKWAEEQSFFPLLYLILRLDRVVPWEDQLKLADVSPNGFAALNRNQQETGVILAPKVPSFQDNRTPSMEEAVPTRKWQSHFDPGINQELKNIYCIPINDCVLRGHPCQPVYHVIEGLSISGRKKVRIGLLPVVRDAKLETDVSFVAAGEETRNTFTVKGVQNWEQVKARIQAGWLDACRKSIDIAVLPECLGNAELFDSTPGYSEFWDNLSMAAEAEGYAAPWLTIGPSWWHDHHNRLYVTDSVGNRVCVQEKQFPFEYQENGQIYLEDIRPDTPKINVLNIPWIGRIGLAVCADLLHSEMVDLLVRTLHCNFIICAAYSPGKTLFTRICESSVSYGTTTIWLNACSASSKPEEGVGVIAAPGQNIPLRPECGGNCGGDDAACLFVTELDLRTGEFTPPQHICPLGGTAGT